MIRKKFATNVSILQDIFTEKGLETINDPYILDQVEEKKSVIDCVLVAKHGEYDIIYAEVKSNQQSISSALARSHFTPCLIVTKMDGKYSFTSLYEDKPYYVQIKGNGLLMLKQVAERILKTPTDHWKTGQGVDNFLHTIMEFQE